jgi:hypothetical protein
MTCCAQWDFWSLARGRQRERKEIEKELERAFERRETLGPCALVVTVPEKGKDS